MGVGGSALLERTEELDRLDALAGAAARGGGAVAIVEGQAGIGKTTLLEAAIGRGRAGGLRVLRSRAGQLEHEVGWNVVRQLFDEVVRADEPTRRRLLEGAAALAEPALGLSEGSDAGALHGLYWLTEGLCEQSPLLIAVDDAHWADDASLSYLAYLAERVEDLRLVMFVTVRTGEELSEPLSVMMSRPWARRISLRELSSDASAQLAREALGASTADAFCDACYEATTGNPFLLHELLGQLASDGIDPTAARAPEVARITSGTVRRSVLLRLSRFGPDARKLASAVAALGESGLNETATVAGVDADAAANLADALAGAGILSPGDPLRFVHAIVREAVYGELPPLERSRLHRRAAEVLAADGDHRRAAAQLLETSPDADPWVVEELIAAADAAIAEGAPGIAASLLRRAVREPPGADELPSVLVALGRAEAASGGAAAAGRMTEAIELVAEPRRRAEIQLQRGRLLYLSGRLGESARAFDDGLRDLADDHGDLSLDAELRAGWLTVARLQVSLRRRAEEMTHAIAADPPAGGTYGERALLAHVAGQLTFDGEPRERGIELAYRALGGGQLIRQETSDGLSWVAAMGAIGWGDDFDGFEALQLEAIEDARGRGSVLGYATAMYGYNFTHYYRGMLGDAIDDARRAIDAERDGWRHFLTASRAQLAWALIEQGELEAAEAQLDQALVDAALEGTSAQALVAEARAPHPTAPPRPRRGARFGSGRRRGDDQRADPEPVDPPVALASGDRSRGTGRPRSCRGAALRGARARAALRCAATDRPGADRRRDRAQRGRDPGPRGGRRDPRIFAGAARARPRAGDAWRGAAAEGSARRRARRARARPCRRDLVRRFGAREPGAVGARGDRRSAAAPAP